MSLAAFSTFSKFSLDLDAALQISLFYWQNACLKKKIRANQYCQDLLPIHTNTQSKQRLKTNTQKNQYNAARSIDECLFSANYELSFKSISLRPSCLQIRRYATEKNNKQTVVTRVIKNKFFRDFFFFLENKMFLTRDYRKAWKRFNITLLWSITSR